MWEVNLCLFHHPLRHCAFWPVFVVMGYDGNAIQCFLILIGSRRVRGNAGRGRSQFHNGKEGTRPRQMCRQVVWSGTTRPDLFSSGLPTLFVSHTSPLLSFHLLLPLFYLMSFHLSQWKKTTKKKTHFHVHLMSPGQKRKMIQTMEVSTYQLFVAISSRLPQSALGPGIKCKTETPH